MKISATEEHGILLEEIFNAITLRTKDGEELSISMRDSGFEFYYQSKWYFAKEDYVGSFLYKLHITLEIINPKLTTEITYLKSLCSGLDEWYENLRKNFN